MYKDKKIILIACCYNEEDRIGKVAEQVPYNIVDEFLVIDDGSEDTSGEVARAGGAKVIRLDEVEGVGYGLRVAYNYARDNNFDIAVTIAGNNKDRPQEITRLLDPIIEDGYDFVQGSRYLTAKADKNMPLYRKFATKLHPFIFSLFTGKKVSESTNGYRSFKVSILDDKKINLDQEFLDNYELEPYLYYKAITSGYKTTEAQVSKIYPPKGATYTKMRGVVDWWSILRPLFYLRLGVWR